MSTPFGQLASDAGYHIPIQVLRSGAGFYIGTFEDGPVSRESMEYYPSESSAIEALLKGTWTQRDHS